MAERQQRIETNKSIRLIKNELEALLEKGVITDDAFESIHGLLPAETPLSGATPVPAARAVAPAPPTASLAALTVNSPPSYSQSTGGGPPPLPGRNNPPAAAAAAAPPAKPVLTHARALYRYAATDGRDCSFERDDRIAVFEYMNADWWMGRNERTGQEGIFPKNYVEAEQPAYPAEKSGGAYGYQAPAQPTYGGYPPAHVQQNPYNSSAPPPMAIAEQPAASGGGGKGGEMGKKFGKKLGNAAIFGAGATIGSNIVNSIF